MRLVTSLTIVLTVLAALGDRRVDAATAQAFKATVVLAVASQHDVHGQVYDHVDTLKGSGTATTLGKISIRIDERAYDRNESFSDCNQFVADGFFTGRQGTVQFIYLHTSCRDSHFGRDHDSGTFTVIGGTGKYIDAYGSGTFQGRSDVGSTGKLNWTFTGRITFPFR